VVTTAVDTFGKDSGEEAVTPIRNPQTGPFYVEGAEPGDTLIMNLDRISPGISPSRDQFANCVRNCFALSDAWVDGLTR
jgi:acetamidase/formamidase